MRLLISLTYYHPHVSGLTIYVQRLAEGLVRRGHEVTVLTAHHDAALPKEETLNGVRIVRVPAPIRVSKGVIMPSFPMAAVPLLRACDAVVVNLPGSPGETFLAILSRGLIRRPIIAVYHCDVQLSGGIPARWTGRAVFLNNWTVSLLANRLVAYTRDYARHSPLLGRFPAKVSVIPPPVVVESVEPAEAQEFRERFATKGEKLIGFPARFASEKGVEVVLKALDLIREKLGPVRVLFAGPYKEVIGEERYRERMKPLIEAEGDSWVFLGTLSGREMAQFYAACDLIVLPSLNSTESFGLVQVESMLCGTPVVASDLPGVRVPIQTTGMGLITPSGEVGAFAEALVKVVKNRNHYQKERSSVLEHYSLDRTLSEYEKLLRGLIEGRLRE